ncbi:uncharacterized protein LOC108835985 isoform X2 [Raphanus sativus]|uniref:Uncharacterized protein LOC108835985 isoform X2 n=1 Tax=Raphanus sativus TaxID=3726 RepID=A0A9W3DTD4_RAPSA|nr:uncharacterized protein LOC108835985 isoform X2 [Raphanus sativus]
MRWTRTSSTSRAAAGETSRDTTRELEPSHALEEDNEEIPDKWYESVDIPSLRSLDRSFVFSREQIQILACLSESKGDIVGAGLFTSLYC